uniref:Pollen-specific leucine-rich repeat extensin-like protein 3 n=1 Tax=Panagrellus redivivus TaxID=6233 RepID=A0A7E4VXQ3_PANRE
MAAGAPGCGVPLFERLLLVGVVVFAGIPYCQSASEKLVGLGDNSASQNSRYVEIRRSPKPRVASFVSESDLPQAHGIRKSSDVRRAPPTNKQPPQQQPQQQQQPAYGQYPSGYGLPPPPSPLMHPLMPFYHLHPQHMHPFAPSPYSQLFQQYSSQLPPSNSPSATPPTPIAIASTPATLSATLNPLFTLPTLPTMAMPTFPPFTLPPSFDQMAAGYTKKKKKSRKSRRKAPKPTPSERESSEARGRPDSPEIVEVKRKSRPSPKIETSLPKYTTPEKQALSPSKDSKVADPAWMVPYYNDGKKN